MEDVVVNIEFVIGFWVKKLLKLVILLFVLDMSFGVLLEEVKVLLVKGVEFVGMGICLGEGGMFFEE